MNAGVSNERGHVATVLPMTAAVPKSEDRLLTRNQLLNEIHVARRPDLKFSESFLIVINIADTKKYDEIIAIFGYEFADQLLTVRLEDFKHLVPNQAIFQVGFWSVGFIYTVSQHESYQAYLGRLAACLAKPTICRGVPVPFKAGIGVCDLKKGLGAAGDLLQSTFLAGQISGRTAAAWTEASYDPKNDHRRAFSVIADVAPSLDSLDDFELHFQPRLHLKSMRFTGVEALLRWRHPTLGVISPAEFIPLVETTGLIRELTNWVLSRAIEQLSVWHKSGLHLTIGVNISMKNFDEEDFVERVEALLTHYQIEPQYLELEFSETTSFVDVETARTKLVALRKRGVGIAIDDFGIGPNSLGNVGAIPAGIINIDGSLIAGLRDNLRSQAVVKAMIGLAHELGMTVVGKSIESEAILTRLAGWTCDFGQGYLLGRPMRAAEFTQWCQTNYK